MRSYLLVIIFIAAILNSATGQDNNAGAGLFFKENKKQWDSRILYETELQNGTIFICKTNLTFVLLDTTDMNRMRRSHHPHMYKADLDMTIHGHVFRENFLNTNTGCRLSASMKQTGYYNYYIGKDPSRWASGVNGYGQVVYNAIYNNIDLAVTSAGASPKYNFVVKPGGDASNIAINYEGLNSIEIANEDLRLRTSVGDVVDTRPYAYQVVNGVDIAVKCNFKLQGDNVSFVFPDGYDNKRELIIDPVLIFATYSGSTTDNFGYSATYDSKGNAYAAGTAFYYSGESYPVTPGAFQTSWAGGVGFGYIGQFDGTGTDVSITKYDSAGTTRIYSTYLGGDHDELPHSLIVNSNDELFVMGTTASDNFPVTPGAYDTTFNGGVDPGTFPGIGVHYATGCDIFITRFNSTGTALLGSTYLGGDDNDGIVYPEYQGLNYNYADEVRGEINIDANDNVYIASCTRSKNFPVTAGAYQTNIGGATDGVLVKMNTALTNIIWSTFLGGSNDDAIHSVDFDQNGDLFVAGGTISDDFPVTAGAVQSVNGGGRADGFIAHISQSGNALLQSSYYGSAEYDQVYFVKTDKHGYPYVYGQTEDTTGRFIFNAGYSKPHSGQFISKLSPHLDSVIWSTVFGSGRGTPDISPTAFLVDVCSKTCISGWGSNFSTDYQIAGSPPLSTQGLYVSPGCIQPTTDNQDFYVMVMTDDASAIWYATYYGSNSDEEHVDGGTSRFDKKGVIYQSVCAGCAADCQGCRGQSTFPTTPGAVSRTNNSPNCNNAVFKIDLLPPIVVADFSAPNTVCIPDTIAFSNSSRVATIGTYAWSFGDGTFSGQVNPTHIYTQSGVYNIQLIVSDSTSCNFADTLTKQIIVLAPGKTDTLATLYLCPGVKGQIGILPSYDTSITYLWVPAVYLSQNNVANPFANPPLAQSYELLVSNGVCRDTFLQSVFVYANTLTVTGDTLLCPGDTATISAYNTRPDQYRYMWQPAGEIVAGDTTATIIAQPTQSTIFILTETTPNGCIFKDSFNIKAGTVAQANAAFAYPVPGCAPDTMGFTNQSHTFQNPFYQWSFGDGDTSTATDPQHIYSLPGIYQVQLIVTYAGSCKISDTVLQPVYVLTNSSADTLPGYILCLGQSQQIGIKAGVDSAIVYQWVPPSYLNQPDIPDPVSTPAQSISYQLVISAKTCSDTFTQKLYVDTDHIKIKAGSLVCAYDTLQISATPTQANEQLTYVWQPTAYIISGDSAATATVSPGQTTTFTVTTVNQLGCVLKDSVQISVSSVLPSVHAYATPDTIIYADTTQLNLTLSSNVASISWQADSTIIGPLNIADPKADPKSKTIYVVEVHDSASCKRLDTVIVYVVHTPCSEASVYVPNAFTPNGDGKNDVLYVRGVGLTQLYFAVYDRWGQRMFETTDITRGWDGTFKGKKMDAAVFGYYVKGLCADGENFEKKGNVTLLR